MKRIIAALCLICLLVHLPGLDFKGYAVDAPESVDNTAPLIDTQTADYDLLINGTINTERLTKIGQYSKLSAQE